jgi:hypothetical protein
MVFRGGVGGVDRGGDAIALRVPRDVRLDKEAKWVFLINRLASVNSVLFHPPPTKMSFTLPPLPYEYNALEPHISEQIMRLHHTKHHQTYVNTLNTATQAYQKVTSAKERIALQAALKFNGGGQYSAHLAPDHYLSLIGLDPVSNTRR